MSPFQFPSSPYEPGVRGRHVPESAIPLPRHIRCRIESHLAGEFAVCSASEKLAGPRYTPHQIELATSLSPCYLARLIGCFTNRPAFSHTEWSIWAKSSIGS